VKGTKNTAVFVVKIAPMVVTEIVHHAYGAGRFVVRAGVKTAKLISAGRF